jgi:hypothetical protein
VVDPIGPKLINLVCEILQSGDEAAINIMILTAEQLKQLVDLRKRFEVRPVNLRVIQGRGRDRKVY